MKKRTFSATVFALMIAGILASSTVFATETDVPPQKVSGELTSTVRIIREGEVIDEIEITSENPITFEVQSEEDDGLGTIVEISDGIMLFSPLTQSCKVSAGSSNTGSHTYCLYVNDVVEVLASWTPTNTGTVKIGVTNGSTFYYVQGTNGSAIGSITITTAGSYQFKIKNEGTQDINITSYFSF